MTAAETKLILQDDVVSGFTGFVPEPLDIQKKGIHEKSITRARQLGSCVCVFLSVSCLFVSKS